MDSGLKLQSNWTDHINFARWLVSKKDPELTVDLGTFQGVSAFAFAAPGKGRVITIDQEQFEQTYKVASENCHNLSIVKSKFDDCLNSIEDKSIDILHVDGDHRINSVAHDLEVWMPKLKPNGILLMHDVLNPIFLGPMFMFNEIPFSHKMIKADGDGLGIATNDEIIKDSIISAIYDKYISFSAFQDLFLYFKEFRRCIYNLSIDPYRMHQLKILVEKSDLLNEIFND